MIRKISALAIVLALSFSGAVASQATAAETKKKSIKKKTAVTQRTDVVSGTEKTISAEKSSRPAIFSSGKLDVEPMLGLAFNSVPGMGASFIWGAATTYRLTNTLGLGLGFSHFNNSIETPMGFFGRSRVSIGATFLTVESRIIVYKQNKLEAVVGPQLGLGFYSSSVEIGPINAEASTTGIVLGSTAGARYWFADNMAAGASLGYRLATGVSSDIGGLGLATQLTWNL